MDENALRAAGIDYDAALARFMGKQACQIAKHQRCRTFGYSSR